MKRLAALLLTAAALVAQDPGSDAILRAMEEELKRAATIRLGGSEPPYFIDYTIEDVDSFTVSATMGGLVGSARSRARVPRVQARVGAYEFDNTSYIFSNFFSGTRYDPGQLPLDNDPLALRHTLWLATDRSYKSAVESLARKRAALKSITQQESLPDFTRAAPVRILQPLEPLRLDEEPWRVRVRTLSALFRDSPRVLASSVDFEFVHSGLYYANSEGTRVRIPDHLAYVRARASGLAVDGMPVRDSVILQAQELAELPAEAELRRGILEVAANVTALAAAPRAEDYSGPVLVEGVAAPQLFAQLLGANLALSRRPVSEPGRTAPFQASELEGRQGSRILPEWMDVVDDPTQTTWRGRPLFGRYPVDMEGVVPAPLRLVESGVLKTFLLTRQPVRGFSGSNGRARMPGQFGAKAAGFGNLFIRASQTVPSASLKQRLIEMCQQRGKPFGLILRKLDYPSSASFDELRRMGAALGQRGGGRPVSSPILAYRVYPDGREELVRGLRFRGISARSLRDILAAGDQETAFDFLANGSPLALIGSSNFVVASTVVAPAVLFEDLELERVEEDWPKPPVVPPPGGRGGE